MIKYSKNNVKGVIFLKYIIILLWILGFDVVSKYIVDKKMSIGEEIQVVKNTFYFRHIKNNGFAYNKFAGETKSILLITGTVIAVYSSILMRNILFNRKKMKKSNLSLSLIIGGALGNFFERFKKGYVTDFLLIKKVKNLKFKNPPIFNVADVSLLIGFIIYTINYVFFEE